MAIIDETRLKSQLKAGLARVYLLFGEEHALTKIYENRIVESALGKEPSDLNYVRFTELPSADSLSDFAESMPFFSDYKVIVISDLDAEKLDNKGIEAYVKIIEELPETTVLIISQTGIEIPTKKQNYGKETVLDQKAVKAKTKKLVAAAEKAGVVCEFSHLSNATLAGLAMKKATQNNCNLSEQNAVLLAELCGRDMKLLSTEVQKLCDYTGSGEITNEAIDLLVPKMIDTGIYALSDELFAGRTANAFRILDDLFAERIEPVPILSTLSGHFVDCYRAKLATLSGQSANDVAAVFNYPKNRSFVITKAMNAVRTVSPDYLKSAVQILYRTNKLLNSSTVSKRLLIEQALTEISTLRRI